MPFCPNCGCEVDESCSICPECNEDLVYRTFGQNISIEKTNAVTALRSSLNIVSIRPMVLVPSLLGAFISMVISLIVQTWFVPIGYLGLAEYVNPDLLGLILIGSVLGLIGSFLSYVLNFASLDMSRDAYLKRELVLSKSINYVIRHIMTFIVASIAGAILAITIVLIPVAILMYVIIIIDEIGVGSALSRSVGVFGAKLTDIIILMVISIGVGFVLSYIPIISSLLNAFFNVIVGLAFMDIYFNYKRTL